MPHELEPVTDLAPVQWVEGALPEFGNFRPAVYVACASILHAGRMGVLGDDGVGETGG